MLYSSPPSSSRRFSQDQSGNMLIIILIAIALLAALTAAIQGSSGSHESIDSELLIIRASQVRQHAGELERGVYYVMQNGVSENDLRFAHPLAPAAYGDLPSDDDPTDQVFSKDGGGAHYKVPSGDINDGSSWEFFGQTALPNVGSDEADLVAVLPNVNEDFCDIINESLGYDERPRDTAVCIKASDSNRFGDNVQFSDSPNTTEEDSFSITPAKEGCVQCVNDNSYHYFHVLMGR